MAFYSVFQVLDLEGKFSANGPDLIDLGIDHLQFVQGAELVFYRSVNFFSFRKCC